jgi:serine/threonine protein kinase
MGCV